MPIDMKAPLRAQLPTLCEERGERRLLLWGQLGQWLVADRELQAFVEMAAHAGSLDDLLQRWCRETSGSRADVEKQTEPIVQLLLKKGVFVLGEEAGPSRSEPQTIANLTFNITNRCNLQCPWCYNENQSTPEAPIGSFLDWLQKGKSALAPEATLIILGGEPFLVPERLQALAQGARKVLKGEILVSTNGTLAAPDILADLRACGVTVQISLDGADAATHDRARGKGVFDKALQTHRQLREAGVYTVFSMVLTKDNQQQLETYMDLALAEGAREVRFIPLRQIHGGLHCSELRPDLAVCFQDLMEIVKRRPETRSLLGRDYFSILMTVSRLSRYRTDCGIGRRVLFVDSDGSIYPCPNHRQQEQCCGSIVDTPLSSLLKSSPVLQSTRQCYDLDRYPRCKGCDFRYWCAGDCRAEAQAVGGDRGAPSPYCACIQTLLREMLWLAADGESWLGGGPLRNWDG